MGTGFHKEIEEKDTRSRPKKRVRGPTQGGWGGGRSTGGWSGGRGTGGWVWGGWWDTVKLKYCQSHAGPPFRSRRAARRGFGNFSFPGPTPAARCLLVPQPRRLLHPRAKPTASLERSLGNHHSKNAIGLAWGCGNLDPCDHSKSGWGPCGAEEEEEQTLPPPPSPCASGGGEEDHLRTGCS